MGAALPIAVPMLAVMLSLRAVMSRLVWPSAMRSRLGMPPLPGLMTPLRMPRVMGSSVRSTAMG